MVGHTHRSYGFALVLSGIAAACSTAGEGDNQRQTPGRGNANYGEERIGYKSAPAPTAAVNDEGLSAAGSASGQASGTGGSYASVPTVGSEPEDWGASYGGGGGAYYGDGGASSGGVPIETGTPDAGHVAVDAGTAGGTGGANASADGGGVPELIPSLKLQATSPRPPLENPFRMTSDMPASTFSIDVDTGAYTLARASLNAGHLPEPESVRIEEFINYFHFHYGQPEGGAPFSVYSELSRCPWSSERQLLLVGIQGQEVPLVDQPAANLVFLLDVSGSMSDPNKLPLLKSGFRMLAGQLREQDVVSIVTYAGHEAVVLEGASGADKERIFSALDQLESGGSTNGAGGIQRAYEIAQEHFVSGGNNRVLLATDGDFNVGLSGEQALSDFIATKRETGVFLSVYGFGDAWDGGNYQDTTMEQLADNGNGIYFYIDSPEEARRAFIHTLTGSLLTVAKDVKLQLEFNPSEVAAYRLIGYENRVLSNADFSNDSVDAGELGAGLSVTALFEIVPPGAAGSVPAPQPGTDPLEQLTGTAGANDEGELLPVTGDALVEVRVRYKGAGSDTSKLIAERYTRPSITTEQPSMKFMFASAVSEIAMQLRGSQYLPARRREVLRDQIRVAFPADAEGAVAEFHGVATTSHTLMTP